MSYVKASFSDLWILGDARVHTRQRISVTCDRTWQAHTDLQLTHSQQTNLRRDFQMSYFCPKSLSASMLCLPKLRQVLQGCFRPNATMLAALSSRVTRHRRSTMMLLILGLADRDDVFGRHNGAPPRFHTRGMTQLPKKTGKFAGVNRSAPRPVVSGSSVSRRP
jgi:hypothetical protein